LGGSWLVLPECVFDQLELPDGIYAGANGAEGDPQAVDLGGGFAHRINIDARSDGDAAARIVEFKQVRLVAQPLHDVRMAYSAATFERRHQPFRFFLGAGPNTSGRMSYRVTAPPDAFSISNTRFVGQIGTNFHWLIAER
jgi:hypothetical protein